MRCEALKFVVVKLLGCLTLNKSYSVISIQHCLTQCSHDYVLKIVLSMIELISFQAPLRFKCLWS
jgi:hypothetical protein